MAPLTFIFWWFFFSCSPQTDPIIFLFSPSLLSYMFFLPISLRTFYRKAITLWRHHSARLSAYTRTMTFHAVSHGPITILKTEHSGIKKFDLRSSWVLRRFSNAVQHNFPLFVRNPLFFWGQPGSREFPYNYFMWVSANISFCALLTPLVWYHWHFPRSYYRIKLHIVISNCMGPTTSSFRPVLISSESYLALHLLASFCIGIVE